MDRLEEKMKAFGEAYAMASDRVDYEFVRKAALQDVVSAIRKEIADTIAEAIAKDNEYPI